MSFRGFAVCSLLCLVSLLVVAQDSGSNPASKIDNAFVQKQFGSTCTLTEGQSAQAGDLNGDGVEDLAIPAHCTNPMIDQVEHNFTVVDPYYSFFGYGDPKITSTFVTEDPANKGLVVLVIHGSGPEAWYSPKEKFVIINLAYKHISLRKMMVKKKKLTAIYTEEAGGTKMIAAVFWDGRKYKYEPMGSSLE